MSEYAKARRAIASRMPDHHSQPRRASAWMLAIPAAIVVVAVPLALSLRHSHPAVATTAMSSPVVAATTAQAIVPVAAAPETAAPAHPMVAAASPVKPIPVTETTAHEAHEKKAALVENKSAKATKEVALVEPEAAPLMISSGVPVARHEDDTPDVPAPDAPQMATTATTALPGISLPAANTAKPMAPKAKPLTGGTLVQRVSPVYPQVAMAQGIEGQVQLKASITTQGVVENIRRISGQPLLVQAGIDAVKHWRYDPFKSDGVPIAGEVTITLNFKIPR
jgi:protein TonB